LIKKIKRKYLEYQAKQIVDETYNITEDIAINKRGQATLKY